MHVPLEEGDSAQRAHSDVRRVMTPAFPCGQLQSRYVSHAQDTGSNTDAIERICLFFLFL